MGDSTFGALIIVCSLLPLVLIFLAIRGGDDLHALAAWRRRMAIFGTVFAGLASVALPVFYIGLRVLSAAAKSSWFPEIAPRGLFGAWVFGAMGLVLLGFARGRRRWMGMASSAISFVLLYVALMALSY